MFSQSCGGIRRNLEDKSHESNDEYVHSIKIDKNSKFYQLIGEEKIMVNSRHIGYSSDVGKLKVVATSPDGVDEVVEDASKTFYIGVQFHPESLYKKDENMRKIFTEFIKVCKENKK